jgi:acetyl-CoA decarbonylase/synthase, CODH/ACS complex subunit gamma
MALTGLQIQKLLPKTNCKECGSNTCLAFAMKLAAKKADLSECPYASDEAKAVLGAASEPPVKGIELGNDKSLKVGEETVLYRHEKTFVNRTLFAININDNDSEENINKTIKFVSEYFVERVGETLKIELVSITQKGSDKNAFAALAKRISEATKKPLILRSTNADALSAAASAIKGTQSIIASANSGNVNEFVNIAKENGHNLCVTGKDLNEIVKITEELKSKDFNNLILELPSHSLAEMFQINTIARRTALKDNYKPLGYATIKFVDGKDEMENAVIAVTEICKYGGILVLPSIDIAELYSLMTLRLNIFTDPQKPIQVDPKVYPVGEPDKNSPVFVTTNFSLTYFLVSGEIENSGKSAWLVVPQCEGMSVLTAWSAGKFSGASIAKFIKEIEFEKQVDTRQIIIPGYIAQISGELEENLPGWKVIVGPQEAADIESFVKARL